jgi:hypothetical protein
MTIFRATSMLAAAACVILGAAVGLASPASAAPLSGDYTVTVNGTPNKPPWTMTPCGADCTTIATPFWTADAHLQGNNWVSVYPQTSCVTEQSKTFVPGSITAIFDKDSLAGTLALVTVPGACPGGSEEPQTLNIVLTKR